MARNYNIGVTLTDNDDIMNTFDDVIRFKNVQKLSDTECICKG